MIERLADPTGSRVMGTGSYLRGELRLLRGELVDAKEAFRAANRLSTASSTAEARTAGGPPRR